MFGLGKHSCWQCPKPRMQWTSSCAPVLTGPSELLLHSCKKGKDVVGMGWCLDLMISEVFSKCYDSMIMWLKGSRTDWQGITCQPGPCSSGLNPTLHSQCWKGWVVALQLAGSHIKEVLRSSEAAVLLCDCFFFFISHKAKLPTPPHDKMIHLWSIVNYLSKIQLYQNRNDFLICYLSAECFWANLSCSP